MDIRGLRAILSKYSRWYNQKDSGGLGFPSQNCLYKLSAECIPEHKSISEDEFHKDLWRKRPIQKRTFKQPIIDDSPPYELALIHKTLKELKQTHREHYDIVITHWCMVFDEYGRHMNLPMKQKYLGVKPGKYKFVVRRVEDYLLSIHNDVISQEECLRTY